MSPPNVQRRINNFLWHMSDLDFHLITMIYHAKREATLADLQNMSDCILKRQFIVGQIAYLVNEQ